MRALLAAVLICSAGVAGHLVTTVAGTTAAAPGCHAENCSAMAAAPVSPVAQATLAVHEWGTFTSFSGSNGVPVAFAPNNSDLPGFVYFHEASLKSDRFDQGGLVSMETPVMYFYTDKETRVSVQVDFPKGWITEWYPFASTVPGQGAQPQKLFSPHAMGETIRWNVKLTPDESPRFPRENGENHYYHARETDSVPLQTEFAMPEKDRKGFFNGASILQREKFLFYRGVGTFLPPVNVQAKGGGMVKVTNAAGGKVAGLVLVTVLDGRIGFRSLDDLEAGMETVAMLPETNGSVTELTEVVVKGLIAAGLYEREARAMVKTWDSAWFREEGTRLLYLVPRMRTDELLPLTVDPRPTELVRVLVGRHDFLTPEQEANAEQQMERIQAAQAEIATAEKKLSGIGRFGLEARRMAVERLAAKAGSEQK
jgi:hypothetical protein